MFKITPHSEIDKMASIFDAENEITLYLDYDDVWHPRVDFMMQLIANVLNENIEYIDQQLDEFDSKEFLDPDEDDE